MRYKTQVQVKIEDMSLYGSKEIHVYLAAENRKSRTLDLQDSVMKCLGIFEGTGWSGSTETKRWKRLIIDNKSRQSVIEALYNLQVSLLPEDFDMDNINAGMINLWMIDTERAYMLHGNMQLYNFYDPATRIITIIQFSEGSNDKNS
jgi:hypothetical protein